MAEAIVKVEYETLPKRQKRVETLTIADGLVGLTSVIKALIGKDVTGCEEDGWYWRPTKGSPKIEMPATLVLKKLSISGDGVTVGNTNRVGGFSSWTRGDTFQNCPELKEVHIESDHCKIANNAFWGCKALQIVVLSDGITTIGDSAFYECTSLSSLELPPSLESIGNRAFCLCKSLKTVNLPDGLVSVGERSFGLCESLTKVSFPSSLCIVGPEAFYRCDRLDPAVLRTIGSCKYDDVLLTADGVEDLCRSQAVSAASREEAAEVSRSAAIAGRFTGNVDVITNAESLLKYLKLVSEAETSVMQLTEALALALSTRGRLEEMLERRKSLDAYLSKRQNRWSAERDAISNGERLSESDTGTKPSRPQMMSEPAKPIAPEPRKPGLFNRKRIEAENAEAERLYQEALAAYEAELSWVRDENAELESAYRKDVAAWKRRRSAAIKRQLDELGPQPSDRPKRSRADSDVTKALKASVSAAKAMCKELEKKLVEASGLLKLAYSADVIFPKYRNIEAMTTMYEYFETGRCTSLKGPDGAYNLYESELRSNAIIGRLDVVSDKLDRISDQLSTIQANQYVLYKAVEGVSERLDAMSTTLGEILSETKSTGQTAREISAKASAMVRNSAEIAYWARKNAELTDSLGYLIAFAAL